MRSALDRRAASSATFWRSDAENPGVLRREQLVHLSPTMNQWRERMNARTHAFAVDVIVFVRTIPDGSETRRLKDQLVGAAWGMNGNWRAACRARTHKEFTAKLGTVVEEADEAEEALHVIDDSKMSTSAALTRLRDEAMQLRAIFTKASRTASDNERRNRDGRRGKEKGSEDASDLPPL